MIAENLKRLKDSLPPDVELIAVSKTKPESDIELAYSAGQRHFGENKVQEMVGKWEALPKDIKWHLIGHLQRNKVKHIAPFVHLIHAVDSLKLLQEINKQAAKHDRVINCLLQFHIAEESTKFGMDMEEARALLNSDTYGEMDNINLTGVMGMASFTSDGAQIRSEFDQLKNLFEHLRSEFLSDKEDFKEISMGMSGDYEVAISCGSTMIRVGSKIFGIREYH